MARPGAFEGRLFDDHADEFVSDEGDRVLLDQVDQVAQVLPRALDIHKVHQALQGSQPDVHKLEIYVDSGFIRLLFSNFGNSNFPKFKKKHNTPIYDEF